LIDTGVSVYIILENLAKKFKLKIKDNDRIKVIHWEGKARSRL